MQASTQHPDARGFLVDDDAGVREAMAWLLRTRRLLSESFASADEFLANVATWRRKPAMPTAVDAVKRGAFDFCEKPFSDNALVDRVEQALNPSARVQSQRSAQHSVRMFDKMGVKSAVDLVTNLRKL